MNKYLLQIVRKLVNIIVATAEAETRHVKIAMKIQAILITAKINETD